MAILSTSMLSDKNMENILSQGPVDGLFQVVSNEPDLKASSNIITLSSNEIADISVKISSYIRKELSIDQLLESSIKVLAEAGIAERFLLFQTDNENTKALLTHYWESPYVPKFNPVGFQLDLRDAPLFKLFRLNTNHTIQIEDFSKYLPLPNYLFRNKFKALFIKLKTRSMLVTTGSSQKVKVALNLQFGTKEVIWSNEIEKFLQSVVDQLATAIDQYLDKRNKEVLQKNIIQLQEKAIREQEGLLRQFASDVHDLPCTIIPNLKKAIRDKDFIESERLVDELHNNLRQLINEYIVPDISILGFGSTLYQFLNGFKKSYKGKLAIEMPNEEVMLSNRKDIEIFKVIKEWFCNIEKHSESTEVFFKLEKPNENYILITITDNGKGFDITNTKNLGYGIQNIKRRLNEIDAKFEISSEVGKGALIKIQLSTID
jgi:two-component sensor histidine kinase